MAKKTKVSIIIPVFNADLYLEDCLNSVLTQSLKDIEVICINDNSKDESLKILQNFAKNDKRIKIIDLKSTFGQSHARNKGLLAAKGEYIGFVDADDFAEPEMFEKMYTSAIEKNSEIVMCKAKVFDEKVKNYKDDSYFALDCFDEKFYEKPFNHQQTVDFMTKINVSVWNKLYKTDFLKENNINFIEGFIYEDLPFFFQTYTKAKKVTLLNDFLYVYRINSKNSTMTRTDKNVKDRVDMMSYTYDILQKQTYFKKEKAKILNWLIHDLFYRCLIIDSKYQKEYFFRMQKFFKTLDTADVDETLLKSPYYPHFCEIKKKNYTDIIKYFFDKETLGEVYVKRAKEVFEKDFQELGQKVKRVQKMEDDNLHKKYDLEQLQDKILEDEKLRWEKFNKQTENQTKDFEQQKIALNKEKENLYKEIQEQKERLDETEKNLDLAWQEHTKNVEKRQNELKLSQQKLDEEWEKVNSEREKRKEELDLLQEKILQDEKNRWADFNSQSEQKQQELEKLKQSYEEDYQNKVKNLETAQAELDNSWKIFKQENEKRKQELDSLQNRILEDEKERWAEFDKKNLAKKEEFENLEKKLYSEIEKRNTELNQNQYDLDKNWEKFKIDTLKRENELNELQNKILNDEKERWKQFELKKAEYEKTCELQKAEFEQKELEFKKNKEQNEALLEQKIQQFEQECEVQRQLDKSENERQKQLNKLALEKTKNKYANKYLEDIEEEKTKLSKNYSQDMEKEREYFSQLVKEQLKLQEETYKKNFEYKKKIEEEMMSRPKVSVILPVYNVAPYLRQALDSVINQTLTDIEIICVDDGSTDESGKILDEYKEKDERIKVIHKKNAGTGAARNDGLKIATGECIGFVDPDDWILPNMYERLYSLIKEKDLDIVMFTPDVFNDKTKKHEGFLYFQNSNFPDFLDNKIFNKDDISPFSYPMCVWNKLYTKKLFDENNINFAEGLDFEDHKVIFKSLFTAKRIYFIREKLYVYRHSREGSILSDNDTRMFDHIKIYDIVENILKETGNWEKFHLDFLRYKVHNILYYYTMIKPQYKKEYYNKMVKSLRATKMSEDELNTLNKDYPDLKPIMEDTLVAKIKKSVKKIIKKDKKD